jgi:hypothetical protein
VDGGTHCIADAGINPQIFIAANQLINALT